MLLYSYRLAPSFLERCRLSLSPLVQQLLLNIYRLHKNNSLSTIFLTGKMNTVKVDLLTGGGGEEKKLKQRHFNGSKSANNKNM